MWTIQELEAVKGAWSFASIRQDLIDAAKSDTRNAAIAAKTIT